MMYQICVVVLCVLSLVYAGWHEVPAQNNEGIKLVSGISLHLDDLKRENASLFEKHALRVDYMGMGVSVGKALNKDDVEFGLYVTDKVEGRRKKVGNVMVPALIGLKIAGIAGLFFSVVTFFVLKSVAITKLSAVVAAGVLLAKLFHSKESENHVEVVPYPYNYYPAYYGYPSATGYDLNGAANYHSHGGYDSSDVQRTDGQYSVVETSNDDTNATASKRFDLRRHKHQFQPIIKFDRHTSF